MVFTSFLNDHAVKLVTKSANLVPDRKLVTSVNDFRVRDLKSNFVRNQIKTFSGVINFKKAKHKNDGILCQHKA